MTKAIFVLKQGDPAQLINKSASIGKTYNLLRSGGCERTQKSDISQVNGSSTFTLPQQIKPSSYQRFPQVPQIVPVES